AAPQAASVVSGASGASAASVASGASGASAASAAAAGSVASAPAGASASPSKQVADNELPKYIRNLRIRMITDSEGTHLHIGGLGAPGCLRHLKFSLDRPVDDNTGMYGIRVRRSDVVANGQTRKTEDDCNAERTNRCSRDADSGCVTIQDGQLATDLGL